jgi:hypothetical protein
LPAPGNYCQHPAKIAGSPASAGLGKGISEGSFVAGAGAETFSVVPFAAGAVAEAISVVPLEAGEVAEALAEGSLELARLRKRFP